MPQSPPQQSSWFELVEILFWLVRTSSVLEIVECEHVGMTMTESGSSSFLGVPAFWLLALIAVSLRVA